jgi:hypothetical protein
VAIVGRFNFCASAHPEPDCLGVAHPIDRHIGSKAKLGMNEQHGSTVAVQEMECPSANMPMMNPGRVDICFLSFGKDKPSETASLHPLGWLKLQPLFSNGAVWQNFSTVFSSPKGKVHQTRFDELSKNLNIQFFSFAPENLRLEEVVRANNSCSAILTISGSFSLSELRRYPSVAKSPKGSNIG